MTDISPPSECSFTNATSNRSQITLLQLPDILLENILKYLSYKEVTQLRETCQHFNHICGRFIRVNLKKLRKNIENELEGTAKQIAWLSSLDDPEVILKRAPYFRKYNRLELLLSELNIVTVLCRHVIDHENVCFPGGLLLDAFLASFRKVLNDTHETWSVMDFTSGNLQMKIKLFLDDFRENFFYPLSKIIPIGVQIVDLMDTMLETDYDIKVTYDMDNAFCEFSATYEQRKPKFLSYTSHIMSKKLRNVPVDPGEMLELMKQLQLIVRIHNELLLRQEQYWREMDVVNLRMISESEDTVDLLSTNILTKIPRKYTGRQPIKSKILPGPGYRVYEHYKNTFGPKTRYPRFICKINLKCLIKNAPIIIQNSFQKLLEQTKEDSKLDSFKNNNELEVQSSAATIISQSQLINSINEEKDVYSVTAEFHMITPMGLSNEEIEMFEMYWSE